MGLTKSWRFEMTAEAERQFSKLDTPIQKRMVEFFKNRLLILKDPRSLGKPLSGQLSRYWSYRIGDYRIIADIQDEMLSKS